MIVNSEMDAGKGQGVSVSLLRFSVKHDFYITSGFRRRELKEIG